MANWKMNNESVPMDATKSIAALVHPPDSAEAYWTNSLAVGTVITCVLEI